MAENKGEIDYNLTPEPLILSPDSNSKPSSKRCGRCRQSIFTFSVCVGFVALMTNSTGVYLVSQITTLERYFGLSSSQSGLLLGMNDVGFFSAVLVISYFSRYAHIPRLFGIFAMLAGLAALVSAIPHFLRPNAFQKPVFLNISVPCQAQHKPLPQLCGGVNQSAVPEPEDECNGDGSALPQDDSQLVAVSLVGVGMLFVGIGKSPRASYSLTYIDDNIERAKSAVYTGLTLALSSLGLVFAYGLGAGLSKIHVTLQDVDIWPGDPRWIGAWWLGFVVFGLLTTVAAIPMFFLPKTLRTTDLGRDTQTTVVSKIRDIPKTVFRLFRLPVYMLLIFGMCFKIFRVAGFGSFFPKYMETHFGASVFEANVIAAVTGPGALVVSFVTSGFIINRLRPGIRGLISMAILFESISTGLALIGLVFVCPQPEIRGLGTTGLTPSLTTWAACSAPCRCPADDPMFPVCGADNTSYLSPCLAGCTKQTTTGYSDCLCVGGGTSNLTVTPGLCKHHACPFLGFALLQFASWFCVGIAALPIPLAFIRCVLEKDKMFSLGLAGFLNSLIGWFLGPILYGSVIDTTCLKWNTAYQQRGACALYDRADLRIKYHVTDTCTSLVYILLYTTARIVYVRRRNDIANPNC